MKRTPLSPATALRQELLEFNDLLYLLSHIREEDLDAAGRIAGVFGHCARFLDALDTRMQALARQQAVAGEGGAQ